MDKRTSPLNFENAEAADLARELAICVCDSGLGALSKTDFYDFVLYLLDKHSREHFLSCNSNQANAMLLKVKTAKVKASKLNIFLKFANKNAKNEPLREFIRQIANGKIRMDDAGKNKLQLTIEDSVMQFCIKGALKTLAGAAPDIRLNSEILVISKKDFFNLLKHIIKSAFADKERDEYAKRFKNMEIEDNIKTAFSFVFGITAGITGNAVSDIASDVIKDKIKKLFAGFLNRGNK